MIKWWQLVECIPQMVSFKKMEYEVLYVDDFKDGKTLGETRFGPNQIVLKRSQNDKELVHTYVHEVLHAISEEYKVGLSEKQVLRLEKALTDVIKPDNIFLNKFRSVNAKQRKR